MSVSKCGVIWAEVDVHDPNPQQMGLSSFGRMQFGQNQSEQEKKGLEVVLNYMSSF